MALLCGLAVGGGALAAPAPGVAPPPAPRPGAAAPALAPAALRGDAAGMRLPLPRPGAPKARAPRADVVEAAAAQAFVNTPRPRPRPTGMGFVPAQDLTAHAADDMADDGPAPAHGAVAPGEVTGGTRQGFASTGLALVGIFGAPGDWRALVRSAAGKVDYVHVGARIGDWHVAAISGSQVQLVRGLQSRMLTVPDH